MIILSRAGVVLIVFLLGARFFAIAVQFAEISDRADMLLEEAREKVRNKEEVLDVATRIARYARTNARTGRYIAGMTLFIDLAVVMVLAWQIADPPKRTHDDTKQADRQF